MATNDINVTPVDVPDGGWGWVIVAASFVSLTIQGGTTVSSTPVLYAELIETFGISTATVGWLGSAFSLTICLTG